MRAIALVPLVLIRIVIGVAVTLFMFPFAFLGKLFANADDGFEAMDAIWNEWVLKF